MVADGWDFCPSSTTQEPVLELPESCEHNLTEANSAAEGCGPQSQMFQTQEMHTLFQGHFLFFGDERE